MARKKKIQFTNLTTQQKIYLGAFIKWGYCLESKTFDINLYNNKSRYLIPNYMSDFDENTRDEIFYALYKDELIIYTPDKGYVLNVYHKKFTILHLIEYILSGDFEVNKDDIYDIWYEIALWEVWEYLQYQGNLIFNIGFDWYYNPLRFIINDLLNEYKVSEIFFFIYHAINKGLRFHVEKKTSKETAISYVINELKYYPQRAKNNGYKILSWNRINSISESTISIYFFEYILKSKNILGAIPNK